jgi:hypothetical protein
VPPRRHHRAANADRSWRSLRCERDFLDALWTHPRPKQPAPFLDKIWTQLGPKEASGTKKALRIPRAFAVFCSSGGPHRRTYIHFLPADVRHWFMIPTCPSSMLQWPALPNARHRGLYGQMISGVFWVFLLRMLASVGKGPARWSPGPTREFPCLFFSCKRARTASAPTGLQHDYQLAA